VLICIILFFVCSTLSMRIRDITLTIPVSLWVRSSFTLPKHCDNVSLPIAVRHSQRVQAIAVVKSMTHELQFGDRCHVNFLQLSVMCLDRSCPAIVEFEWRPQPEAESPRCGQSWLRTRPR
jgi:hypothetical protein